MPSSQAAAAAERHNDKTPIPPEPPKLKTALKTPPKQATNPLQFVKVGPCSLYRTAQEQLQKVQEVKKVKQEIRDDPEDWQSNLDNWKSSRRKRQEHIIERVVEVKKLELEEHDRQRRRSKTFSEMMEERGNRGRKLSISLAVYNEEDANDLSDLGIGTSSGKSSVSGDTHDDTHSVLSDRDSEIDKNHSDVDNANQENGADGNDSGALASSKLSSSTTLTTTTSTPAVPTTTTIPVSSVNSSAPPVPLKKETLNNGFHKVSGTSSVILNAQQDYDSGTTATLSSPEPEEYTYEGAIRGYVSRVSQNIPRRSLVDLDAKLESKSKNSEDKSPPSTTTPASPVVKVDILKRREIFEKATRENAEAKNNNLGQSSGRPELGGSKSIKERLSILERQKAESEALVERANKSPMRFQVKPNSVNDKEIKTRDVIAEELESVKPLRERLSNLEKFAAGEPRPVLELPATPANNTTTSQINGESLSPKSIKARLVSLDAGRAKEQDKRTPGCYHEQQTNNRAENNSTPSERSSSPDSEYRAPRATFHQSLDSLDADASSGPDTFERVQSLEELDYRHQTRRYPASSSSAEILNDTDREDSGIHTADASCSVSQADEPIEEEAGQQTAVLDKIQGLGPVIEEKSELRGCVENTLVETSKNLERVEEKIIGMTTTMVEAEPLCDAVLTETLKKPENQQQPTPAAAKVEEASLVPEDEPVVEAVEEQLQQQKEVEMVARKEKQQLQEKEFAKKKKIKEEQQLEKRKDEQQQQQSSVAALLPVVMESPLLVQEALAGLQLKGPKKEDTTTSSTSLAMLIIDNKNNIQQQQQQQNSPPVRPTTLALEKTTMCPNFLSPMSPASKQILPLSFSSDEEIVSNLSFSLGPPTSVEPPKEKPPPPPVDLSDEENHPIEPLKRLNSTRRIKKELRSRRSDFLGIEGFNDDELERELTLSKPPDMAAILAEERRIEQLHRRSYDTDSNYEQDSSHERDSGVELGQAEDWSKQPVSPDMSQHSRQSSEPFGASVTSSEEDEISKKEREIIEVLEREEQWRYENNREINNSDIGEKLAHKLRELEEEKMQLERERASQDNGDAQQPQQIQPQVQQQQQQQPIRRPRHQEPTAETLRMNEENLRKQEELARKQNEAAAALRQQEIQLAEEKRQQIEKEAKEQQLRMEKREEQERRRSVEARRGPEDVQIRVVDKKTIENKAISPALSCNEEEYASREVLRVERELLQLEQEELKRQRNNLAFREQKQQQQQLQEQWKSLQDVAQPVQPPQLRQSQQYNKPLPPGPLNYRASMPNLQLQETNLGQRRRPPPPPIPPAKPLRLVEQRQRMLPIGNSRIPSADSIPQQVEAPLRPSCSATTLATGHHGQQMTRQTLQALSAVPRPRIVQGDQWVQRRKSDVPRAAHDYNYQHWLIQEAEQRRISEKNSQRSPARKPHVTGTSVPYTASPPRADSKPLPDSIIQTLTQRVQNRVQDKPLSPRRRLEHSASQEHLHSSQHYQIHPQQHKIHQSPNNNNNNNNSETQEKMLSVSGKKKCSHCGDELGRGAAMIIESLRLFYHMECFKCCVCHVRLGDGLMGTDVRVRNHKLHCHNCYSSDDGVKFSCV